MTDEQLAALARAATEATSTERFGRPWVVLLEHQAAWSPERALAAIAVIEAARVANSLRADWAQEQLNDALAAYDRG